ncbi:MAG: ATP phosphoribosyltransferase [Coriobacteriales bacterium]|jgi:ATP phosphoribosyltransferase regulatory subunit|nr:ATP phosphoribosyltransferase [Coriobacteriales bacterium]
MQEDNEQTLPVKARGFKDILPKEALWREQIIAAVQSCLSARNYLPIETPTLEVLQVMERGGKLAHMPFRLFDTDNELLALRPDVTLPIARMVATRMGADSLPLRLRYVQRVFREEEQLKAQAREYTQIGIESLGHSGAKADAELILLFDESLAASGLSDFTIAICTVQVLECLTRHIAKDCNKDEKWINSVLASYHKSDFVALSKLAAEMVSDNNISDNNISDNNTPDVSLYKMALNTLPTICGGKDAIDACEELIAPIIGANVLEDLRYTWDIVQAQGTKGKLKVDFSVMSTFDYYTSLVIEAYAPGVGVPLGSGGRYDRLLGTFGVNAPAAGFAFSLENVMQAMVQASESRTNADIANQATKFVKTAEKKLAPLKIAVPKGALYKESVALLAAAGLDTNGLDNPGRQLVVRNEDTHYYIVRPTDVPVFVSYGGVDCAICGRDSLAEADLELMELVDLRFGACRFVVAEPREASGVVAQKYSRLGLMRVATKYPRITASYYDSTGTQVEIVKMHGNIELAPLCGMAERIVDITATGTTLSENNLVVVDEVLASTARFVGNTTAVRIDSRVRELAVKLADIVTRP